MRCADIALNRWPSILARLGVEADLLTGKEVDCPLCKRKKKFRFDDQGRGTWICVCGSGDGFSLLQQLFGWTFRRAADEVEKAAGFVRQGAVTPDDELTKKIKRLRAVWAESVKVTKGDVVTRYLESRGLTFNGTKNIRLHPGMELRDEDGSVTGVFPVMLSRICSPDGNGASLHRTYLSPDGKKIARKIMPGKGISGGAVRLMEPGKVLGVGEGIETCLAAHERFRIPVWSCISATVLESFQPPACVEKVVVFGDHDLSFTGQAAAFKLAQRMKNKGLEAVVMIPGLTPAFKRDIDWLDMEEEGL